MVLILHSILYNFVAQLCTCWKAQKIKVTVSKERIEYFSVSLLPSTHGNEHKTDIAIIQCCVNGSRTHIHFTQDLVIFIHVRRECYASETTRNVVRTFETKQC